MSRKRPQRQPKKTATPTQRRISLLLAAPDGEVFEHPQLDLVIDDGIAPRPADPTDLVPLDPQWEIMQLPEVLPLGFDPQRGTIEVVDHCKIGSSSFVPRAVAIHPPPGYVRSHFPGALFSEKSGDTQRPGLPLWAYSAVGASGSSNVASVFQVDETSRWAPELYDREDLPQRIQQRLAEQADNRILKQLAMCGTEYGCRCAQNIFYERWEGALPIAPACNAACLGCLSKTPEWQAPVPQHRLRFHPSVDEIAAVITHHVEHASEPMVSFGQGCEGEPTLNGDLLVSAVQQARAQSKKGIINLNTNGSKPKVVQDAIRAGVGAVRVSVNTFDEQVFNAYFRPEGFALREVVETLRISHAEGAFTSINLLLWPGWTDRRDEVEAISALVSEGCLDMIQLRNLCVDPAHYNRVLPQQRGQRLGMKGFVLELASRHPKLRFGTFNPRLAADWYKKLPPLPFSPLAFL